MNSSKKNKQNKPSTMPNLSYQDRLVKYYKVDPNMKFITYKGAFSIAAVVILATNIVPSILAMSGFNEKQSLVFSCTVIGGFGVAVVRNFIESNRGFGRGFVALALCFAFAFFVISYYWIYYHHYI